MEGRFYKGSPWNFEFLERKRGVAGAKALVKEAGYKGKKIVFEHRFFGVHPTVRGLVTDSNESLDNAEGGIFKVWLSK